MGKAGGVVTPGLLPPPPAFPPRLPPRLFTSARPARAGELLAARAVKGDPALQKRIEIERADEHNRAIADRAKGKAFARMTFVFGALMLTFALMEVELAAVLLLVAAYLFVEFSAVYYRCKLEKQM